MADEGGAAWLTIDVRRCEEAAISSDAPLMANSRGGAASGALAESLGEARGQMATAGGTLPFAAANKQPLPMRIPSIRSVSAHSDSSERGCGNSSQDRTCSPGDRTSSPMADHDDEPKRLLGGNAFKRTTNRHVLLLDGTPSLESRPPMKKGSRSHGAKRHADSSTDVTKKPRTQDIVDAAAYENPADDEECPHGVHGGGENGAFKEPHRFPAGNSRVAWGRRLSEGGDGGRDSAAGRLERAVLGGLTWCSSCQCVAAAEAAARGDAASTVIPLTFESARQYVSVFEPILHEEARAGVQVGHKSTRTAALILLKIFRTIER